ncbi:MAG TPA: histidine kinase [Conexibacter sp.]|jgi:signal transduction histidine kinase
MTPANNQRSVAAVFLHPRLWRDGGITRRSRDREATLRRNAALEAELRATADELHASRARIVAAGARERRRIERDLHDSGQNRLIALRIKLELAAAEATRAGADELHDKLVELGGEAQDALDAVRSIAHGIYPPLLATSGLAAALSAEVADTVVPVRVDGGDGVPRSTPDVEAAVYHCCLEAVQNACKHAGPGARVTVALACAHGQLRFAVDDDGPGIPAAVANKGGRGLTDMRDRIAAVDGTLAIDSDPRVGTSVHGAAPWPQRPGGEGRNGNGGGPGYQGDFL